VVRNQREALLTRETDDPFWEIQNDVVLELYDAEALTIDLHGNETPG
jgi:hypothetical protein